MFGSRAARSMTEIKAVDSEPGAISLRSLALLRSMTLLITLSKKKSQRRPRSPLSSLRILRADRSRQGPRYLLPPVGRSLEFSLLPAPPQPPPGAPGCWIDPTQDIQLSWD